MLAEVTSSKYPVGTLLDARGRPLNGPAALADETGVDDLSVADVVAIARGQVPSAACSVVVKHIESRR